MKNFFAILMLFFCFNVVVDGSIIARWRMDDNVAVSTLTTAGTIKPDILGTGTVSDTYNGKSSFAFSVLGWQIINDTIPDINDGTTKLMENIEYDSVSNKYWWIASAGLLWQADTMTGTWTYDSQINVNAGAPCLKEFGSKWYNYYTKTDYNIYVQECNTVNGTYVNELLVLSKGAAWGDFDYGRADECYVVEANDGYIMVYMGGQDPNFGANEYEKTGVAWCATPNGTFIKLNGGLPVLSGNAVAGQWNSGMDRAADPYAFQLDANSSTWYVGTTACITGKSLWTIGYFQTTDFITYTAVSTLNPLFAHGASGTWDDYQTLRGAVTKVGDVYYVSYAANASIADPYKGGIAILNINPTWYCWYDGAGVWNISTVKGTQGAAYWSLTSIYPNGTYTAGGTASGTLTVTIDTAARAVVDSVGGRNGIYYRGTPAKATADGSVAGKINSALDFNSTAGESVAIVLSVAGVQSITMWVNPDSIAVTDYPLSVSSANYISIVNGTVTKNGFTTGTQIIYVDGQVSSIIPDTNWHFVVMTSTVAYTTDSAKIGRRGTSGTYYFNGVMDDVRLYDEVLTPAQINFLYRSNDVYFLRRAIRKTLTDSII